MVLEESYHASLTVTAIIIIIIIIIIINDYFEILIHARNIK